MRANTWVLIAHLGFARSPEINRSGFGRGPCFVHSGSRNSDGRAFSPCRAWSGASANRHAGKRAFDVQFRHCLPLGCPIKRWLASLGNDPRSSTQVARAGWHRESKTRRPYRRVPRRRAYDSARQDVDGAIRRSRGSVAQDREPVVACVVRPDAKLPGVLCGVRARHHRPWAPSPLAGDAARAHRAAARPPRQGRQDPPLSVRALDSREVGGTPRGVHARVRVAGRAPAAHPLPVRRSVDDRAQYLVTLFLQQADPGNLTARQVSGSPKARRMVPAAPARWNRTPRPPFT